MKTFEFEHPFGAFLVLDRLSNLFGSLCGLFMTAACLALFSFTAMGADWPPILNPDPNVQPPKWDWQLAVPIQVNPDTTIKIYDIDMFQNETSGAVQTLHDKGYKVICYVDVGSWENWRDDASTFPENILGNKYYGFPDERWLDVRDVNPQKSTTGTALATILTSRFNRARNMGCDAIEPDNMDVYDDTAHDPSGFPLTYDDQIYFNLWVASTVHSLTSLQGNFMLVGLKNDINQAHDPQIYTAFDFVVSEQCVQYNECGYFSDFLALNKPVFEAEYSRALDVFCPVTVPLRISAIRKHNALNAYREDCSAYYPEPSDTDGDGMHDNIDNCINVANADQRDTDGDGYGNACDADLVNTDGQNIVNLSDYSVFRSVFGTADPDADFNGDGMVNLSDYSIFRAAFGKAPGPSCCAP